jgi:hypothetical protein
MSVRIACLLVEIRSAGHHKIEHFSSFRKYPVVEATWNSLLQLCAILNEYITNSLVMLCFTPFCLPINGSVTILGYEVSVDKMTDE